MVLASKLTTKYQATIPKEAREALGLGTGDLVCFEVRDGAVVLRRATPMDAAYLKALESTLSEWLSESDEEAYADL